MALLQSTVYLNKWVKKNNQFNNCVVSVIDGQLRLRLDTDYFYKQAPLKYALTSERLEMLKIVRKLCS